MRALAILVVSLFLSACVRPLVIGGTGGGPGGPGPGPVGPGPGNITAADAERIALRVAAEHGYTNPRVEKAHHDEGHGGRWKVEVRGIADGRENKIDVRIADDGAVTEVKDHRKGDKDKDDKKEKKEK